jgi:hypothetical protein
MITPKPEGGQFRLLTNRQDFTSTNRITIPDFISSEPVESAIYQLRLKILFVGYHGGVYHDYSLIGYD